jgi:Flp pilus assembly pilin Flp
MKKPTSPIRSKRGQGITEYGAVLAFVAVLFVIGFLITGNLCQTVSTSYSAVNGNVGQLNTQANLPGGGL